MIENSLNVWIAHCYCYGTHEGIQATMPKTFRFGAKRQREGGKKEVCRKKENILENKVNATYWIYAQTQTQKVFHFRKWAARKNEWNKKNIQIDT